MSAPFIMSWWATVQDHYGGIENFKDTSTVRIIIDRCHAWLDDNDGVIEMLEKHPEERAKWIAGSKAVRAEVVAVRDKCNAWLDARLAQ